MLHRSIIEARGLAQFPEFTGERVYMEPFLKADGLPSSLARWQPTVDAMLDGIDTDLPVFIMIDQSAAVAGARPSAARVSTSTATGTRARPATAATAAAPAGPACSRATGRARPDRCTRP